MRPITDVLMTASHTFLTLSNRSPPRNRRWAAYCRITVVTTPTVWGNGYSVVQSFCSPAAILAGLAEFLRKIPRCSPAVGSGAPGGVFTPTCLSDYPLECFWPDMGILGCRARFSQRFYWGWRVWRRYWRRHKPMRRYVHPDDLE